MRKLFAIASILALSACGDSGKESTPAPTASTSDTGQTTTPGNLAANFEISGLIKDGGNQVLTLEALSGQGAIQLAQTSTRADGSFNLKGNIQGMGLYQLKLGSGGNKVIPMTLSPQEKIVLTADYNTFERLPKFSGSEWAPVLTAYMEKFNTFAFAQTKLADNKNMSEADQIREFLKLRKPLDDFAKAEMLKSPANPANIVLSTSMTPSMGYDNWDVKNLAVLQKVANAYAAQYQGSPIAASMATQVQQIESGLEEYQSFKTGTKIAPEITLKNPDGKTIKLSSLRGQVVLVDFWASWCGPCRKENPNVVRLYKQYKDKGFTVYSVSLDKDAASWKRAIEADGLIWPNHVSDLLQWESPMQKLYGFDGIPYTVLLNKEGKIIGTNLRGAALEQKLKEVLK
jgi:thiol-disulfide isomerase/thioredoxin